MYEGPASKKYSESRGTLNQSWDDMGYHQSTLAPNQKRRQPEKTSSNHDFVDGTKVAARFHKLLAWWVMFLHYEGRSAIKFISGTLMSCCMTLNDLEVALSEINDDRTICKNNDRQNLGECQSPGNLHKHLRPSYNTPKRTFENLSHTSTKSHFKRGPQ